jgi:hypothetical protein
MLKKITLVIILCFAIFLRLQGIFTQSFPFTYDIGRDLLAAADIAHFEKIPLIGATTGLPGLFYGPSWYYILGILYIPLLGDPTLYTAFINLTGVLAVFLSFLLGKKIGGDFLGLTLAALFAVSPVVVSLTSQLWNPDLIPIFIVLTFFVIYGIYLKPKKKLCIFLGLLLGLIIDMEIVVGLLFLVGIITSLLATRKLYKIKDLFFVLLGFMAIMLPRVIFDVRHQFLLSNTLLNGLKSLLLYNKSGDTGLNINVKINSIFSLWNDTLAFHNPLVGIILLLLIVLVLLFGFKKEQKKVKFITLVAVITLAVSLFGILLLGHDIWPHYLVALPILFIMLMSLALTYLYNLKKFAKVSVVLAIVLVVGILNPVDIFHSLTTKLWEGDAAVYRNQTNAIDYVYKTADGKRFKYIVYTPPVYDYTYRYLFDWYGPKKYGYLPSDKNPELFFVIIEPDYQFPDRVTDWLKIRANDGKIISASKQKGGIIIQTRTLERSE